MAAAWAPPPELGTTEWADTYRYLAAGASALPGKYSSALTPWITGIHAALDDKAIWKIVMMKSAQVAWTDGGVNNYVGRRIHTDPVPMIIMFAKEQDARDYNDEKFVPMVTATPVLRELIDVGKTRNRDNRALRKKFPGGMLKLVGSNSPGSVKSTPAPVVFVEEPDDSAQNVRDQGDSIDLLIERTKTFYGRKVIFGGTPSVKGVSKVEAEYALSDQRRFHVPCHECGESHVLDWENVHWDEGAEAPHEIYGTARPETARYACPHCGAIWDDHQKNRNVHRGEWKASRPCRGVAGFYINELYSPFPGSRLARLVERHLEAKHHLERGDDRKMVVFINSALGLPYEYQTDLPETEALKERAEDYPELTVPRGGLLLTAGIDVQHDRLAIVIRAWGRDEESWLLYWGELYAQQTCALKTDPVWSDLEKRLFSPIRHETGAALGVSAVSIDSSDGTTSDAVYHWVRKHTRRGVVAAKGSSDDYGKREIFAKPPQSIDTRGQQHTKAAKYGLRVYIVGTHRAKDLILGDDGAGRIKLTGAGPARMHWYKTVRADYYGQLLSEIKAPSRRVHNKKTWQVKSGVRNEALDCEVLALHASRSRRVHLMKAADWDALERRVMQADLFSAREAPQEPTRSSAPPRPRKVAPPSITVAENAT